MTRREWVYAIGFGASGRKYHGAIQTHPELRGKRLELLMAGGSKISRVGGPLGRGTIQERPNGFKE